jgi:hypothetical protein
MIQREKSAVGNVKMKATWGNTSGSNAKEKATLGSTTKKLKELGEVAALAESGQGGKVKTKAKSGNATKVLVESASGTERNETNKEECQ